MDSGGNVGIGTTAPASKLSIRGNIILDGDDFWLGLSDTTERIIFDSDGDDIELMGANIGIGTTAPASILQIAGDFLPTADDQYDLGSSTLRWQDLYLGPASLHIGTDGNEAAISYNATDDRLYFNLDGAAGYELTMLDAGNLGIGTTNPGFELDVNGDVRVAGGDLYITPQPTSASTTEGP